MVGTAAPWACVLGDVDLLTALGAAGIRSAVAAPAGDPARYSRFTAARLPWDDPWERPEQLVASLLDFAGRRPSPPVLYFQSDADLLLVSRHRDALAGCFRFVVAEADLVEDCVDKARFMRRAEQAGLPVPASQVVRPADHALPRLRLPVVAKPLRRRDLARLGTPAKAVRYDDAASLAAACAAWRRDEVEVLVQELVTGPESRVESYHAYVDPTGSVVAEFTGTKLRTVPAEFGHSTLLTTTDSPDVAAAGRDVVRALGLVGVVKVDFKRDDDGRLWLLEVNPRFTLWHALAAAAGMNIPALVHADLTGALRPAVRPVRAGLTWVHPLHDLRAVRAAGLGLQHYVRALATADARSGLAVRDPWPALRGMAWPVLRRRLPLRGRR